MLKVKLNQYGRGVYTTEDIPTNTKIIIDNLLLLNADDCECSETLKKYVFKYSKNYSAICLGLGSLINHSFTKANCTWIIKRNQQKPEIVFSTTTNIPKGTELLVDYGVDYWGGYDVSASGK